MSVKGKNAESYVKLKGSLSLPDAIHGKSAYELAVIHGFEGTEEDFVKKMQGYALTDADKAEIANIVLSNFIDASEVSM